MGKLLSLLFLTLSAAAQTAIDPNSIYLTPLHWVHAIPAAGIDERTTYATVLVLAPDGQFTQLSAGLIEHGREKAVTFSNFEGLLLRRGTWSRTDQQHIRLQSRLVQKLDRSPDRVLCDPHGKNCNPTLNPPPGPLVTESCTLEGHSRDHLAQTIHCPHLVASPLRIPLSLPDLQNLTR